MCFYHFHFFFWWSIKFPQQHINQSETWTGGVQMSVELYATIWMLPAIYRKYKTNNFSKIRQDLPELFFFHVRLWNQKNFRSSCWLRLRLHWRPILCDRINVKQYFQRKIFVTESNHIPIETSKYTDEN